MISFKLPSRVTSIILFGIAAALPATSLQAATLVVANKSEATASLIDLDSGNRVATLPTGNAPHEVGISIDGRQALVSNYGSREDPGNSLTLIDIPHARVIKTIDLGKYQRPHGVEWLDSESAVVTVEANQALILVDIESGSVIEMVASGQEITHMVALDRVKRRAFATNIGSGSLTVIDLAAGRLEQNIATGDGAEGVALSASGAHVWVSNRAANTLSIIDAATLETVREIPSGGFPIRATASPQGQVLVTRAEAGELVIYDDSSFTEIRTVAFDIDSMGGEGRLFSDRFGDSSVPIGLVVDDTGERAFVAHANADVITEIDLSSGEITRLLHAGKEPDGMGYSVRAVQ